jgi:hypothetical protein
MNRRNIIKAAIGTVLVPTAAVGKSAEEIKRETMRGLLSLPRQEASQLNLLRIAMHEGHYCREYALELFESGIPMSEVHERVTARVNYELYGPEGAPVYDENGRQIGGSRLRPFAWQDL